MESEPWRLSDQLVIGSNPKTIFLHIKGENCVTYLYFKWISFVMTLQISAVSSPPALQKLSEEFPG